MGQRTLVYRSANVDSIRAEFTSARASLQAELDALFSTVDSTLAEWSHETDSRQAERRAIRGLREAIDRLLAGLDRLERELGVVQDAAETAETRNVGLLD